MNIFYYCQHVLGVGHFFRTLEICRALSRHRVTLVSGGPPMDVPLPAHVKLLQLPPLIMDENFGGLLTADPDRSVETVRQERIAVLGRAFSDAAPEVLLIELYPFGRKAFRFELDPLLASIRNAPGLACRVFCSLRDILVEKKDPAAYEKRVVDCLNRYFDGLLVHGDPQVVRLSDTFQRLADIRIPLVYTGFVTSRPPADARRRMRRQLGLGDGDRLIVASAGGGKVGHPLLQGVVAAFGGLHPPLRYFLEVFAGPFMEDAQFEKLRCAAGERIRVRRFTNDFLSYLAAADLSVSMAGYNTCMNTLAAGTPALVWPFAQNREQRLRIDRLGAFSDLELLEDGDLQPERLADRMAAAVDRRRGGRRFVDLDGARYTAEWIEQTVEGR